MSSYGAMGEYKISGFCWIGSVKHSEKNLLLAKERKREKKKELTETMQPSTTPFSSRRSKLLLVTFTSLCIVGAVVGVVFTAANRDPNQGKNMLEREAEVNSLHHVSQDMPQKRANTPKLMIESSKLKIPVNKNLRKRSNQLARKLSNQLARERVARAAETSEEESTTDTPIINPNPGRRDMISCVSHRANNTIPAAHIKGHGTKAFSPATRESAEIRQGYQQRWQCCEYYTAHNHNAHAFVDGGMIFNQTDKSLRVPTCGYYHVFSQIYYHIDDNSFQAPKSVFHLLKFERNCSMWPQYNPISVIGTSVVTQNRVSITTYTSDIVRLCAGGKIWVEIPDGAHGVPCCPMGDEEGTFIGAYLVSETACHWPPAIELNNFNK